MSSTEARYIDADAYKEYSEFAGPALEVTKLVPGTPSQAFDVWIQHSWLSVGETMTPGVGRGQVGNARKVLGNLVEQIVSVGEPDGSDRIASVRYKVREFGSLPAQDHVALVSFVADASAPSDKPATLILWNIKIVTTWTGTFVFCGGSLLRALLRGLLDKSLDKVRAELETQQSVAH